MPSPSEALVKEVVKVVALLFIFRVASVTPLKVLQANPWIVQV